jgi:hypothetical protein
MTSVYFISFSRKAEVDMLLCLLTTSALFLVANGSKEESLRLRAFRWIGIYGLIGLAWLAKFHYGPAMVLGVIAVWHVVDRKRPGLWEAFNPLGLSLLASAVVIWPWLLLRRVPEAWNIWQTETLGRALGDLGREPVWFYVPQVFLLSLPWSVLLWRAGKESYQRAWKDGDRRERFLWVWFFTPFLILSASAFKHHHYLMAAMPSLSLILGRTLHASYLEIRNGTVPVGNKQILWLLVTTGTVAAGTAIGVSIRWPHLVSLAVALGLCIMGTGIVLAWCLSKRMWTAVLASLGLGFVMSYAIATALIFPNRDRRLTHVEFAESVRKVVPMNQKVFVYGLNEDPLIYYLDGPVCRMESAGELLKELERGGSMILIADEDHLPQFAENGCLFQSLRVSESQAGDRAALVLGRISHPALASSPTHP